MRAIQLLFVLASVAVMANAVAVSNSRTCPSLPSTNPFAPSTCTGYVACEAVLCICAGANTTTGFTASTCLASTTASCDNLKTCFAGYFTCLSALASVRSSDDSCASFGQAIHTAQLADSGEFEDSNLQASCQYNLCTLANTSSMAWSCNGLFESSSSAVCNNATANGTPAPTLAPGTSAPASYAFAVILRLSGSNWGPILSNPTLYTELVTSLTSNLAALLGIDASFIDILSLTQGSLNVDFAVLDGSTLNTQTLAAATTAATSSTTWLGTTQTLYAATNPGETLTVSVVSVGAGPTTTPAPTPSGGNSPSAASATSAVIAAAAAMVAVLAMQ